jgi:non-heme chloroperoxidase
MPMPRSVVACAVFAFLMPACDASAADKAESKTFDAKGVKLHYVIAGKGEPVVLIHGLTSSAFINWQLPGVFAALAKDYQVIAIDMPAHGASDKPEKEEAYGVQLVEDVVLLLDHLKIKKAHMVGYSMGGMITAKLMATHPDRVLSGTLGGMGWFKEGSLPQKILAGSGRDDGKALSMCARSLAKLAITEEELKSIKVPVIVLIGDKDICKQLYVEPLQKVRKDWKVVEIADAEHFFCIAKKEFREEIVQWLAKQTKKD